MRLSLNSKALIHRHAAIMTDFYHHLNDVRKEPLHEGQVKVLRSFFIDNCDEVQAQWGRSGGKSSTIMALHWLWAMLNDNSLSYIIAPQRSHGKKIFWTSGRIQRFGPPQYIAEYRDSELILVFKNGSKICIDGSENYEALRGIKPHLVSYDEAQKHSKEFHVEVMEPNLIAKASALGVFGTPPARDCYYVEYRKQLMEAIKNGEKRKLYLQLPSSVNPSLDKDKLKQIEAKLRKRGDEKIWLREYMGDLVFGGEGAVFPDFSRDKQVYQRSFIEQLIKRDKGKLHWYAIFDPGTTTCFAVLFAAINPYTSQVYILDEIYEKDRKKNTATQIWARAEKIKADLFDYPDKWNNVYDEAAAWFSNEIWNYYRAALMPTHKHRRGHNLEEGRAGESIIKDLMIAPNKFFVSENCKSFLWEMENYVTDEEGNYPDKDDHLIDCFFYLINESYYELNEAPDLEEIEERRDKERYRYTTFEREYQKEQTKRGVIHETNDDIFDDMGDIWQ